MAKKKVASKSKPKPVTKEKAVATSKSAKTSGKKAAPAKKKKVVKAAKSTKPVSLAKETSKPVAAATRKRGRKATKKAKRVNANLARAGLAMSGSTGRISRTSASGAGKITRDSDSREFIYAQRPGDHTAARGRRVSFVADEISGFASNVQDMP